MEYVKVQILYFGTLSIVLPSWIMSRNIIFVLIYHRHKLLGLTQYVKVFEISSVNTYKR
jgi:hypothetical protein